jgi:hypothetical protein
MVAVKIVNLTEKIQNAYIRTKNINVHEKTCVKRFTIVSIFQLKQHQITRICIFSHK